MKKKTASGKAATRAVKQAAPPPVNGPGPVQDLQVRIAARAHELYIQRGCLDGYHLRDWLEAEHEVLGHADLSDKTAVRI